MMESPLRRQVLKAVSKNNKMQLVLALDFSIYSKSITSETDNKKIHSEYLWRWYFCFSFKLQISTFVFLVKMAPSYINEK